LQSDCKENGLEKRQIQNGGRGAKLLLFLVNLWAQVKSQCFSAKPIGVLLTAQGHFARGTVMFRARMKPMVLLEANWLCGLNGLEPGSYWCVKQ
jgi:hypothetical protein